MSLGFAVDSVMVAMACVALAMDTKAFCIAIVQNNIEMHYSLTKSV